jgi:deoxyadenosine/deoxycytidine kinase
MDWYPAAEAAATVSPIRAGSMGRFYLVVGSSSFAVRCSLFAIRGSNYEQRAANDGPRTTNDLLLTFPTLLPDAKQYILLSSSPRQSMAKLFELPRYIAVEGPIRVGKSTLARVLGERLAAQRVIEPEDNPFLKAFYEGEPGAAFQAQFAFLIRRFEQLRALDLGPRSNKTVVCDYIFEKDKLFACLNLNDQELDTYNRYFNYFREQLPTPDLVIYLQATPEVLKKRLKKKNAAGEKAISEDYLMEVVKAYEHFFFHYTQSDLLIVNTSEIDFVDRNEDLQELLKKVSAPIKGTQYFLPLGGQDAASA